MSMFKDVQILAMAFIGQLMSALERILKLRFTCTERGVLFQINSDAPPKLSKSVTACLQALIEENFHAKLWMQKSIDSIRIVKTHKKAVTFHYPGRLLVVTGEEVSAGTDYLILTIFRRIVLSRFLGRYLTLSPFTVLRAQVISLNYEAKLAKESQSLVEAKVATERAELRLSRLERWQCLHRHCAWINRTRKTMKKRDEECSSR